MAQQEMILPVGSLLKHISLDTFKEMCAGCECSLETPDPSLPQWRITADSNFNFYALGLILGSRIITR